MIQSCINTNRQEIDRKIDKETLRLIYIHDKKKTPIINKKRQRESDRKKKECKRDKEKEI